MGLGIRACLGVGERGLGFGLSDLGMGDKGLAEREMGLH